MTVTTKAEAVVEPTEDEKKVERAILKLFPLAKLERRIEDGNTVGLLAQGIGLEFLAAFRNLIRQERIRTTARAIFLRNAKDRVLRFYLNKQAAFMGRVSFCAPIGESPHGPISVTIESDDIQAAIDYLAANLTEGANPKLRRQLRPYQA